MRRLVWFVFLVGCRSPEICSRPNPPAVAVQSSFGGWVLVDQPGHAGYEASLYQFRGDGSIALDATYDDAGAGGYARRSEPIGVVRNENGVRCTFGSKYTQPTSTRVAIEGICSDRRVREIVLETSAVDPATKHFGADVISVGGETGWQHYDPAWHGYELGENYEWSFRRCAARSECLDFLDCNHALKITVTGATITAHRTHLAALSIPVTATVDGESALATRVEQDGTLIVQLGRLPRAGEILRMSYFDGRGERNCRIP